MKFQAIVYVNLKSGYSDPEGETTANALKGLGYDVLDVKVSKAYEVTFQAESEKTADSIIDEMCKRLLTNPTKDEYNYQLRIRK